VLYKNLPLQGHGFIVEFEPQVSKISQLINQALHGQASDLSSHMFGKFRNSDVGHLLWVFFNIDHIAKHYFVNLFLR
jgi:hypothetical protein